MNAWRLTDGMDAMESPDDFPVKEILADSDLRQELERLRQLQPRIVSLESPTGEALQIGIGGPFAGLRWYQSPRSSGLSREVLADRRYCAGRVDFAAEGDAIAFWPEQLMPVDQIIDIALFFFENQRLPEWVAWKEWDPARKKWTVLSAAKAKSA